jgi:hypothetical protein
MFGKPSGGLGTTTEDDSHTYYDDISQEQQTSIDPQLQRLLPIVAMSTWGKVPKDFSWIYNPVRSLADKERIDLAAANTTAVVSVYQTGAISDKIFLQELAEQSDVTGVFTNITDKDIESANDVPLSQMQPALGEEETGVEPAPKKEAKDSAEAWPGEKRMKAEAGKVLDSMELKLLAHDEDRPARYTDFAGFHIGIENEVGSTRSGPGWSVIMSHPYGFFAGTKGVDGDGVDVFLGFFEPADDVFVVHTKNPRTGKADEDKCMLGFKNAQEAIAAFLVNYSDPRFLHSFDVVPVEEFRAKLHTRFGQKIVADGN